MRKWCRATPRIALLLLGQVRWGARVTLNRYEVREANSGPWQPARYNPLSAALHSRAVKPLRDACRLTQQDLTRAVTPLQLLAETTKQTLLRTIELTREEDEVPLKTVERPEFRPSVAIRHL